MLCIVDCCCIFVLCCCPVHVSLSSKCCLNVFFMLFCCLLHLVLSTSCCVVILHMLFCCPLLAILLSSMSGFVVHCTCLPRPTELGPGSSPLMTTQSCRHTGTLGRSLCPSTAWSSGRQAAGQEKDNHVTCI